MLSWLADIQNTQPIAHGVIILSLVAALGLALGSIRVRGFSLGIAGTLFTGLIFAHFGYNLEPSPQRPITSTHAYAHIALPVGGAWPDVGAPVSRKNQARRRRSH